jgi:hypothetical protein
MQPLRDLIRLAIQFINLTSLNSNYWVRSDVDQKYCREAAMLLLAAAASTAAAAFFTQNVTRNPYFGPD